MDRRMTLKAKVRRVGAGYGILIPKRKLEEIDAKGEDTIVIKKIDKSAEDIRGMLKGFRFEQETEVR